MNKLIDWWGKGVFFFLCVSIVLLGVGRIELPFAGVSFSSWSISRTTFFFWLIWKLLIWLRYGLDRVRLEKNLLPIPLLAFFGFVTASLLPDFHEPGDYRYFFFASMHSLMVLDRFSEGRRPRLLFLFLGLLPGLLVVRGLLYDPSVLNLRQMVRFGYPLDHPNTAGYLFSMSIPLSFAVVMGEKGRLRGLGAISCLAQWLGLILTYSRGAWLGWGVSALFLGVRAKRRKELLSILVVAVVFLLFAKPFNNRLFFLVNPQGDAAINGRIQVMRAAFSLGLENPILGIGYGRGRLRRALGETYQGMKDEENPTGHAHNVYVELFAETGLLGLGAFLWLLWEVLRRTLRKAHDAQQVTGQGVQLGMSAAWIAFAVTGLGDVPFYHHETRIFFFTLLALIYLYSRQAPTQLHLQEEC